GDGQVPHPSVLTRYPLPLVVLRVTAFAHQRQNGRLRYHKVAVTLEGDLHRRLPEEEREVTGTGLHGEEASLARTHAPRLLRIVGQVRHRQPGAGVHYPAALHGLVVHRWTRQGKPELGALLALLQLHQHAVSHYDKALGHAEEYKMARSLCSCGTLAHSLPPVHHRA